MDEVRAGQIVRIDIETLLHKEKTYQGSWRKRGGVGAFMMAARKWDRLENICRQHGWDIFNACEQDREAVEGALEQVRDLRRYLLLIEEHLQAEKTAEKIMGADAAYEHGLGLMHKRKC
jgi:hypothetical protein